MPKPIKFTQDQEKKILEALAIAIVALGAGRLAEPYVELAAYIKQEQKQ